VRLKAEREEAEKERILLAEEAERIRLEEEAAEQERIRLEKEAAAAEAERLRLE
jgi:hypothetical protein